MEVQSCGRPVAVSAIAVTVVCLSERRPSSELQNLCAWCVEARILAFTDSPEVLLARQSIRLPRISTRGDLLAPACRIRPRQAVELMPRPWSARFASRARRNVIASRSPDGVSPTPTRGRRHTRLPAHGHMTPIARGVGLLTPQTDSKRLRSWAVGNSHSTMRRSTRETGDDGGRVTHRALNPCRAVSHPRVWGQRPAPAH